MVLAAAQRNAFLESVQAAISGPSDWPKLPPTWNTDWASPRLRPAGDPVAAARHARSEDEDGDRDAPARQRELRDRDAAEVVAGGLERLVGDVVEAVVVDEQVDLLAADAHILMSRRYDPLRVYNAASVYAHFTGQGAAGAVRLVNYSRRGAAGGVADERCTPVFI